jgi:hypothetical protein
MVMVRHATKLDRNMMKVAENELGLLVHTRKAGVNVVSTLTEECQYEDSLHTHVRQLQQIVVAVVVIRTGGPILDLVMVGQTLRQIRDQSAIEVL